MAGQTLQIFSSSLRTKSCRATIQLSVLIIVGMVEAFGIVALYGDEGGAGILSDSISKALITTAAGLIIAIPCISIYFILKNRIMGFASVIEVEVENLVTDLYLAGQSTVVAPGDAQENQGAVGSLNENAGTEVPAYAH